MDTKHQAFIGRACNYFAQFLIIVALPFILPPEQFTQYNLIIPALMLGSAVIYGWLNGAAFRWAHKITENENEHLLSSISYYYFALLLISSLITGGLVMFGYVYESLIPLAIFSISIKDYLLKLSNANEDYPKFALANAAYMAGKFLFVALLYIFEIRSFDLILVLFIASELIFLVPFRKSFRAIKLIPLVQTLRALQEMLRYGGPLIAASIAVWIVSLSDRYILNHFSEKMAVANYILVCQLSSNAITVPLMFFITVFFPTLIRMERESGLEAAMQYNRAMLRRYYRYAPIYAVLVGCGLYIALKFFYTQYYPDALLIAIVMCAQLLCGASHFFNKRYELDNRTHLIAVAVFIAALINVACNLLFIPKFGAIGAAISGLIAYGSLIFVTANIGTLFSRGRTDLTGNIL